jgi:hypothetical protein
MMLEIQKLFPVCVQTPEASGCESEDEETLRRQAGKVSAFIIPHWGNL